MPEQQKVYPKQYQLFIININDGTVYDCYPKKPTHLGEIDLETSKFDNKNIFLKNLGINNPDDYVVEIKYLVNRNDILKTPVIYKEDNALVGVEENKSYLRIYKDIITSMYLENSNQPKKSDQFKDLLLWLRGALLNEKYINLLLEEGIIDTKERPRRRATYQYIMETIELVKAKSRFAKQGNTDDYGRTIINGKQVTLDMRTISQTISTRVYEVIKEIQQSYKTARAFQYGRNQFAKQKLLENQKIIEEPKKESKPNAKPMAYLVYQNISNGQTFRYPKDNDIYLWQLDNELTSCDNADEWFSKKGLNPNEYKIVGIEYNNGKGNSLPVPVLFSDVRGIVNFGSPESNKLNVEKEAEINSFKNSFIKAATTDVGFLEYLKESNLIHSEEGIKSTYKLLIAFTGLERIKEQGFTGSADYNQYEMTKRQLENSPMFKQYKPFRAIYAGYYNYYHQPKEEIYQTSMFDKKF